MLNFPSAPTQGQMFTAGSSTYTFDGAKWTTMRTANSTGALPSTITPLSDGASNAGAAITYARGDHRHPTDTSRVAINNSVFTGTLTAAFLTVSGNVTVNGKISSTANGHKLGTGGGNPATGVVTKADASIILYDFGGNNWCGMGVDNNGTFWVRTGLSGTPAPLMYIRGNDQVPVFLNSPTAPTPAAADNSTKIATTEFVKTRTGGGSYLPLAGGTITGSLLLNAPVGNGTDDLRAYRSNGMGVIFMTSDGTRYLINDNSNYSLAGATANASNGRLYGTNEYSATGVYNNTRLAYYGDQKVAYMDSTLYESYPGSVCTGMGGTMGPNPGEGGTWGWTRRFRQMQYYTNGWFAIAYA